MYRSSRKAQKNGGLGYFLAGAGAAAWWLSKEENRSKFDSWVSQAKQKLNGESQSPGGSFPVQKAGNPHPDDIPDNKMVGEGAQFAVDYYNKKENGDSK
ncbi:hypothetical protein [Domibacillus robiginosus]|uniref:hypothetical protein n=1 Tax=Domibacillus robiginosus TaxID=1071054 RepID=UPI00067D78FA|nr:hypothetical protein [Domibacillus robiginosus]